MSEWLLLTSMTRNLTMVPHRILFLPLTNGRAISENEMRLRIYRTRPYSDQEEHVIDEVGCVL